MLIINEWSLYGLGKLEIISAKTEWKLFESGSVLLDNVFVGGSNSDGGSIYVCRVNSSIASELLPGMYDPVQGSCQMTWGGKTYSYSKFDLLTTNDPSSLVWLGNKDGDVSLGSIVGGLSDRSDELNIARAMISGGQAIGKVHGRHSKAYVPFAGKETEIFSYEVLCSFDYKL